ncbi:MAG TPA: hypothetical protein VHP56_13375 [Solirubrobacterales bacterium]|nr:hypothetical protein [Solirubrobacterales bacterium]
MLRDFHNPAKFTPSEYPVTPATTYTKAPNLVDPNVAVGLAVDHESDNLYVVEEAAPKVAIFDKEGTSLGTFGGAGEPGALENPDGIAAATIKEQAFAFVADSPSQVRIFKEKICECAPEIESTSASNVTGDSATLRAKINPGNLETTSWFEYGLVDCSVGPCTKVPAGGESIGAGRKGVAVQFGLTGLQAASTYHFRVAAENSKGTVPGPDKSFTTQTSGLGAAVSDSRAWEMVSPPKKFGGTILSRNGTAIQASSSGGKIAYASIGSVLADPISNRVPEPTSIFAARGAGGRWSNRDLTPPHSEASNGLRGETEFKLFTADLGRAVMEPRDNLPLSPQASEQTPYRWSDGNPPSFTPLLDPSNIPPGTKTSPEQVRIAGASPDFDQIAINSSPPLVAGASSQGLYMWEGGALDAVSQLPSSEGGAIAGGVLGSGQGSVRHAISDDGSRAFWTSAGYASGIDKGALYLRDRIAGESVRLDKKAAGGSGTGDNRPAFTGASADGHVVFFTDTQHLTADASPSGRDLYRCEIGSVEGGGLGCTELSDLSAPLEGSGESAEVVDQMPALSEDGRSLFFVARGVLDEAPNEEGEIATAGESNLYHWQEGQATRFVARLAKEDSLVWGQTETGTIGYAVNISATISPDGRYLAFTSQRSLTGYENQNAANQANTEVYLYDTQAGPDQLTCISCNPSGAAAVGEQLPGKVALFPPDPGGLWAGRWVAATLPQATQSESSGPSFYRPRSVLNTGRVYFNSVDPLVASDSNGEWDVYQYEPVKVGSCAASTNTATQTRSGNGCVGLISSGSAAGDAGFLDASSSGEDVFFLTRSKLSVLDKDEDADVYDARVNGTPVVLSPVRECAGEACQPSPGPPTIPGRASELFKGAETPVTCRKGQRKVRRNGKVLCVKKKQAKHKKQKRKPAKKSGGAAR